MLSIIDEEQSKNKKLLKFKQDSSITLERDYN